MADQRACAPIALFVYNRPWHTRQTVESLLQNDLSPQSDLFIFSDAAKSEAAKAEVAEVRRYIATVSGFRSVTIVERTENFGLAKSIISGVTKLCEEYGQAIVLEDDLVSSPHFLRYMNDALDLYRDVPEVMHVSGSTYPVAANDAISSYFLHVPLCWGWATWKRAWDHFEKDIKVMDRFDADMVSRFNFDGTFTNYWEQLELNRDGRINTWFVFWYATVFLTEGLSLFPRESMLRNIGMDGTGVHCGTTDDFDVDVSQEPIALAPIALEVSDEAFERHKRYFHGLRPTLRSRVVRKIKRVLQRVA